MDQRYEVTIVGAGPSGLAAALYLKRAGFDPLLLEKDTPGGLLRHANFVENYPGFPDGLNGRRLADLFIKHLQKEGVSIIKSAVQHIDHHDDTFQIKTDHGCLVSSTLIISSGTTPKKIKLPGSPSVEGVQLFYDPQSIVVHHKKGKNRIVIIGGGDIAFDYALGLLTQGFTVTAISRSKPTCLPLLYERVTKNGATIFTQCVPERIMKQNHQSLLRCRKNQQVKTLAFDYMLIACGRTPNISFLSPSLKKYLKTTSNAPHTTLPGLFFIGDVVRGLYRQTAIAVGDGIHAAMMTEQYLRKQLEGP